MKRWLVAVALCMSSAGCYTFSPAPPGGLEQGTPVRAHLSPPGSVELRDVTARNVVEVQGEVVSLDPDRAVLSAFWVVTETGFERPGDGVTVTFDRSSVQALEVRRFDFLRSGGLVAAAAAAAYFLFGALEDTGGTGGGGGSGGGAPL